jgi:tripeptidyl-peptidase I
MGFINPWLYDSGKDFLVDIVEGGSTGCDGTNHQTGKTVNGAAIIPYASWNATVGWDPVTGLGIPDFQKMVRAAIEIGAKTNGKKSNAKLDDDNYSDEDDN